MSGRTARWLMSVVLAPFRGGRGAGPRLTILRHHRVYRDSELPLYRLGVGETVLAAQIQMLRRLGLGPLSVREGLERLDEGRPGHWVALSFDDGYADNVERALPLLAAAGARATFYLTAGLIEERRAPWWDVVTHALESARKTALEWTIEGRAMRLAIDDAAARAEALRRLLPLFRVPPEEQASRLVSLRAALGVVPEPLCELATWEQTGRLAAAGMEIGAHTLTHPFLDLLPPDRQEREIAGSVELVARRLGERPTGFAYPGGAYDAASVAAVRRTGVAHAVTTRAGDHRGEPARFELRRRGFDEGMCLGPGGRFSQHLARAELDGLFDRLRAHRRAFA